MFAKRYVSHIHFKAVIFQPSSTLNWNTKRICKSSYLLMKLHWKITFNFSKIIRFRYLFISRYLLAYWSSYGLVSSKYCQSDYMGCSILGHWFLISWPFISDLLWSPSSFHCFRSRVRQTEKLVLSPAERLLS